MEDVLAFVFARILEILNLAKFKNPKTRTWVITILFSLFFGITTWGTFELSEQGSTVGTIIMGYLTVAVLIFTVIFIIRGHRKNWEHY